jgi:uncharacterized membrane protein
LQTLKRKSEKKPLTFGIPDEKIALAFLSVVHLAGAFLLLFSKSGIYRITIDLVPISLALTLLVSLKFHRDFSSGFIWYCLIAFGVGFFSEMVGTNLGWIFGNYSYGDVLGIQIWNTPLMIGINWFLVSYGIGMLVSNFKVNNLIRWVICTFGLVLFDYFMEPVALKHGFWEWHNGAIPFSNYLGWAIISGILSAAFLFFKFEKNNNPAGKIWLIQFGFFLIQNVF